MATKLRPTYAFLKNLELLSSGELHFKDSVKAVTVSYNAHGAHSGGVRRFIKEQLPPIQFKNPNVQFVLLKNSQPTPFVDIYWGKCGDGRSVRLDVDNKKPEVILEELAAVAGIPDSAAQQSQQRQEGEVNMANFGNAREGRFCICEVPGQRPCTRDVPITKPNKEAQQQDIITE